MGRDDRREDVVAAVAGAAVAVLPAVVGGQEGVQGGEEVVVAARAGLDDGDTGGGVRDEDVQQAVPAAGRLAQPFAVWVHSIRTGLGAVPFPSGEEASRFEWTDQARELVADRVATQFVGSPETVAERLRTLQRVTGADELLITTIAHDHADRVRSYELLAKEWPA